MFKVTTKFDSKKIEKDILNAAKQKIKQNPSIIENKLNERAKQLALTYQDETGVKPEVVIRVVDVQEGSAETNFDTRLNISVLNGDDEYKTRVIDFIKSNLKS
ncbi:hypothetical protein HDR61_03610 [bacterium]|nr:hypothetical protein [bacterium]